MPILDLYENWDMTPPSISKRSRLYNLEPIGVGSPQVESLTSYVARLAEAHCVSPWALLTQEIGPIWYTPGLQGHKNNSENLKQKLLSSRQRPISIDGMSLSTERLVGILEILTRCQDLSYLTALTWRNVLSDRSLIRAYRVWCPICLEYMRGSRKAIAEPLVWAFRDVKVCAYHQIPLHSVCHYCSKRLLINRRLGYCPWCKNWLGVSRETYLCTVETVEELNYEVWVFNAISELVATAPMLPQPPSKQIVQQAISECICRIGDGKHHAFSCLVGISNSTVANWVSGRALPSLDLLLRMCYRVGISLKDCLTGQVFADSPSWESSSGFLLPKRARSTNSRERQRIQHMLESALVEDPPPSVAEIAKRLGYIRSHSLTKLFPDLCKQLSALSRRRQPISKRKGIDDKTLKQKLKSAIKAEPPPTVAEFARSLGYRDSTNLWKRFSELCRMLVTANKEHKRSEREKMYKILQLALIEAPPASVDEIGRRLGYKNGWQCRKLFRDLCNKISARHLEFLRAIQEERCLTLLAALKEDPPPSVKEIGRRLKTNPANLIRSWPKLCHKVSERHANYQQRLVISKKENLKERIRSIASDPKGGNTFPSKYRVGKLLGPFGMGFKAFKEAYIEVRREFGLE